MKKTFRFGLTTGFVRESLRTIARRCFAACASVACAFLLLPSGARAADGESYIAEFDGDKDAKRGTATIPSPNGFDTQSGTLAIWFKMDPQVATINDHAVLLTMTTRVNPVGAMGLFIDQHNAGSTSKLRFTVSSSNASNTFLDSSDFLRDEEWHFAVGTFDVATRNAIIYYDGQEIGRIQIANTAGMKNNTKNIWIGSEVGSSRFFKGFLTEASYWTRALSAEEVAKIFERKSRLTGNESGLWGYWPMNKDGTDVEDMSANGHNGTYTGVSFISDPGPFRSAPGMFTHPVEDVTWKYSGGGLQSSDGWKLQTSFDETVCRLSCQAAAASGVLDTTGLYEALVGVDASLTNLTGFAFDANFGARLKNAFLAGGDWMTELPTEGFTSSLSALTNVTVVACRSVTMKPKAFSSVPNLATVRLQLGGSSAEASGAPFDGCTRLSEVYWLAPAPATPDAAYFKSCGANKVVNRVNDYGTDWEKTASVKGLSPTSEGTWQPTGGEAQKVSYHTFYSGDISIDKCLVSYSPKTTPYLGMAIDVSATVRLGSRLLKQGVDYTVTPVGIGVIMNPGEYVIKIAATEGSSVYGKLEFPVTVFEGKANAYQSDMFARLVPEEQWHYENGWLWSDTGWYFVPEKETTDAKCISCNMFCDGERTTGKALETGKLDTTGVYEALTNGDWETWHDIESFTFGKKGVNTSLNLLLKELYIDGGQWMKYMSDYGLCGVKDYVACLTQLESVTVVSDLEYVNAKGILTGLSLKTSFVNEFNTENCRFTTLRIKARRLTDDAGDSEFKAANTIRNIYWNCPPPIGDMKGFFMRLGNFSIQNWVSLDYISDWKAAGTGKSWVEITPFSLTERGAWRTLYHASYPWNEQYIQAYDFTIPIGFTISIF